MHTQMNPINNGFLVYYRKMTLYQHLKFILIGLEGTW